jgi:hypothetical protein
MCYVSLGSIRLPPQYSTDIPSHRSWISVQEKKILFIYQLQTTSHITCSDLLFLKKESPFSFASWTVQHLSFKPGVVKFTLEETVHFK